MRNGVGDLWNRILEMTERLMDKDLGGERLREQLAIMDGLYKGSKSVIDLMNAVTRAKVAEKAEGVSLPAMLTSMGAGGAPRPPRMPDAPIETGLGKRPPLLARRGGKE